MYSAIASVIVIDIYILSPAHEKIEKASAVVEHGVVTKRKVKKKKKEEDATQTLLV